MRYFSHLISSTVTRIQVIMTAKHPRAKSRCFQVNTHTQNINIFYSRIPTEIMKQTLPVKKIGHEFND